MWYRAVGFIVTFILSLLVAPLLAVAQPTGKVPTIGYLMFSSATVNARPFEVIHARSACTGLH